MDSKKKIRLVIWVLIILAILGAWKAFKYWKLRPDPNLYQVVLLTNDQAFYGKLHKVFSRYPYLTDVYYLNPQQAKAEEGKKFTVIKRGVDEIHQPTDLLHFSRENILYWENVGPDSLVARGIKADKEYRANLAK